LGYGRYGAGRVIFLRDRISDLASRRYDESATRRGYNDGADDNRWTEPTAQCLRCHAGILPGNHWRRGRAGNGPHGWRSDRRGLWRRGRFGYFNRLGCRREILRRWLARRQAQAKYHQNKTDQSIDYHTPPTGSAR
jgi:hypothetical protein